MIKTNYAGKTLFSENDMPRCLLCVQYAKFFIRDYGDCFSVYHKNHCCICGHLHDDRKEFCDGGEECGCVTFISQEGLPAIKAKVTKFKNFKNGSPLVCEHQCGSITYGNIVTMFNEDTIICGGCGWAQTHEYEKYLDSEQYQIDLKSQEIFA